MGKKSDQLFIGVDLGGTNIQAGVIDAKRKVLGMGKSKTKADEGSATVIKRIAATVIEAIEDAKVDRKRIGGVGIGAPGTVNPKTGIVELAVNLRWENFPLAKELAKELGGIPVTLDNDCNVAAWGEYCHGTAGEFTDLFAILVGTGIGGGIILDGKLYHGHYLTAGEIGHVVAEPGASIGRRSLENNASRTAIVNLLTSLIHANQKSKITQITGGDLTQIRSKVLAQAIKEEDHLTLEVMDEAARYVGIAIANIVTVMSLPIVVLGGGMTEAVGKIWVDAVKAHFERAVFPPSLRKCKIVGAKLGDNAGMFGAALLAQERLG